MRILTADDDATSRNMLSAILRKWGFDPVVTKDGNGAWAALQQPDAPQLILLDRNMPGMDGLEVCRRLRNIESSNPPYVILLTARGETGDIVNGLEAGANDYFTKPYDSEELRARIKVGQRMVELQTRLLETRNALKYQAMHDSLTGVFNRHAIMERLTQELSRAKREGGKLSVGICDLDHFKDINDTYGHQIGDEVLIAFIARIQARLRNYDCIGRYGGEEFLVIAPLPCETDGVNFYERLLAGVADASLATTAGMIPLTVSIGVAVGSDESTVDTLIASADAALYQAKAGGRNRVAYGGGIAGGGK